MQKIVDYVKQYIGVISIVLAVCILLTYSLSNFKINIESKKAAEMYIGELKYTMTIDGKSTNTLTVPAGETIVDINLTNQNEIKTYYKILYSNNDNISISYYDQTKNTNDEITSYKAPSDSIENKSSNNIKLKIINNSTSSQGITFKVSGGYSTNTLQDVEVPNTYTEITTLETPSNNTYFCETNNDITIGTEYVKGQYTYRYMQEGIYSSDGLAWKGIATDGWGVQLTDKTSTEPVTSKLCTYINNKQITSMNHMFYGSSATTLDLSSFDTSNVTNMSNMFRGSPAKTLALSNFNTSKVTDMSQMFNGSAATTLDLSSFNTSNVTDMNQMFFNSAAKTLDLSSFNTSKVTDMRYMFYNSAATTLDLSSFDTSNVTDMRYMFGSSAAITLDLSSFDTSNVTDMSYMFHGSAVTSLDISSFNTSNVIDMGWMFGYTKIITLDLSSFNTSNVTNMGWMFYSNTNLKTIYASDKFNTNVVTSSTNMFYNTTKLVGGAGTTYNSSYVDKTYARIDGGTSNPGYFTRK